MTNATEKQISYIETLITRTQQNATATVKAFWSVAKINLDLTSAEASKVISTLTQTSFKPQFETKNEALATLVGAQSMAVANIAKMARGKSERFFEAVEALDFVAFYEYLQSVEISNDDIRDGFQTQLINFAKLAEELTIENEAGEVTVWTQTAYFTTSTDQAVNLIANARVTQNMVKAPNQRPENCDHTDMAVHGHIVIVEV